MRNKLWSIKSLYFFIGFIIVGLICVQFYWIISSINLQNLALERRLKEDIAKVVKQVEDEAYCFGLNSKAYIKKGEGVYIVKQKWENGKFVGPEKGGYLDTLDLFNVFYFNKDTVFEHDRSLSFDRYPATVDVSLKFSFIGMNPRIKRTDTSSYTISNLTEQNFRDKLANKFRIDEAIDIVLMDTLIKNVLKKNKLDTAYEAAIRKEGSKGFEYIRNGSHIANLTNSNIKASFLTDNRFNRPYELLVYVPDSYISVVKSMSLMMLSSIIIILVLIFAFTYFVKTILNQKKLSEMKNAFINNITHEFRTPITNINLAIENWKVTGSNTEFYLRIIADENRHIERNVEQILQLATLEHTNGNCRCTRLNVHSLINDTVAAFDMQLKNVQGKVSLHLNATEPHIQANTEQIMNLLYNLLDNAIKYSGNTPNIVISTNNTASHFVLQVEDDGVGISSESQKYIFDRFYRADTGDRHDVKGFGLGLSYVKYIVDTHGGEINVKSKPGKGTKFTIYFPYSKTSSK